MSATRVDPTANDRPTGTKSETAGVAPRRTARAGSASAPRRAAPAGRSEDYASAARLFRALAHPLRVQLVCGLLQEPRSQTAIARKLGLSQSLVAQHLAVLRRAGMVRGTRKGTEVMLEVSDRRVPEIFAAVCGDARRILSQGWDGIARRREKKTPERSS